MLFEPQDETAPGQLDKSTDFFTAEIDQLRVALRPPPKPALLRRAEAELLRARTDRARIEEDLRASIAAFSIDQQNSVANEEIKTLSAELDRAQGHVGKARVALDAEREKYSEAFRAAVGPNAAVAKVVLGSIIARFDEAINALADANASAAAARIIPPKFLANAPLMAALTRQLRVLIGVEPSVSSGRASGCSRGG